MAESRECDNLCR